LSDFDIWFVWTGRGTIGWDGQTSDVSPGSMFCLQPGRRYQGRHDPQHRLGVCYVHFDFVPRPPAAKDWPPHLVRVSDIDFYERLLKRIVSLQQSGDRSSRREAAIYLQGVLESLHRSALQPALSGTLREHHDAIWAVARHIRENPGQLFSIEALAVGAGYCADHFARLFRQIIGQTPKEFCIHHRMLRAQTLLRESALNIEQIAAALGYADVFFFSRQFKQRFGMSPTHFRSGQSVIR